MLWALLLLPTTAGLAALALPSHRLRRGLLVAAAAGHAGLVAWAWADRQAREGAAHHWLALDAPALLFLSITSVLFLAVACYAAGALGREHAPPVQTNGDESLGHFPEALFTACLLFFLATMTLVAVSRHLGLMWVAVEATTLASAPLISFHRHSRSLEATWKYLVICSVGIALALLGNFFLVVAGAVHSSVPVPLTLPDLLARAAELDPTWLKAAFLLVLVGYGTKMGLAPLHTWLPDAHSEAPAMVSALLSGALLNCACLTLFRFHTLVAAAGLADFSRQLLVLFGLLSMVVAAVFILRQADYKRMLAYSSVEHMGVLALGMGVGGVAAYGALLHAVNHSLTKGMLFLVAGNILAVYGTKSTAAARGLAARVPKTAALWLLGLLAISGVPPFGLFLSELTILRGILQQGSPFLAVAFLGALALAFAGMAGVMLKMLYAAPDGSDGQAPPPVKEPLWSIVIPAALGLLTCALGLWIPGALADLLSQAVPLLEGQL